MRRSATPGGAGAFPLRRGDTEILQVLLVGGTVDQAAEHSGLSRSTCYRRLARPGFSAELARRQGEIVTGLRRRTVALAVQALDALRDVIVDTNAPAAARVAAARAILERADPQPTAVDLTVTPGPVPPAGRSLDEVLTELARRMGVVDDDRVPKGAAGNGNGRQHR